MGPNPYRDRKPIAAFQDAYLPYLKTMFSDFLSKQLRPEDRVLELGAGTGKLSLCIAAHHPEIDCTAIDIDVEAIRYQFKILEMFEASTGVRLTNLNLRHGDLFNLPLRKGAYDLVFSEGVCLAPDVEIVTKSGK